MKRPGLRKVTAVCAALAAALPAWFFLAPSPLGGSTAYFVITGSSMEPGLEGGDLVVVRAAGRYEPGDIVAYRSAVAGRTFVHRIVRSEGDLFVLKGDANDFADSTRPVSGEIDGKLWFAVPKLGAALGWLALPFHAAVIGGLLVLLLFGSGGAAVHRRRRRRRTSFPAEAPEPAPGRWERATSSPFARRWLASALVATGATLLVVSALGLVAFSRPTTATIVQELPYRESGTFAYSAEAPAGVVYPDGRVDTGEPLFLRLVDRLQFWFEYRVEADSELVAGGRVTLIAVLSDATGWNRSIDLQQASEFEGGVATATGTLDLRRLEQLVTRLERATGVAHESYALTLAPEVELSGHLAGIELTDRFAPRLQLRLDRSTLELDPVPGQAATDPLTPSRTRSVEDEVVRPAAVSALGVEVSNVLLRRLSLAVGSLLLALLLILAVLRARALRRGEPARIEARFGHLLVPVTPAAPDALGPLVDVATMDGLARLAEPGSRPILHSERLGRHTYCVEDGGIVYRYSSGGAQETAAEDDEAAARLRLLRRHG
jgi:signal peptidase I